MYTSLDFAEHITGHFPEAEKILAGYSSSAFDLYKASISSSLSLLEFLEKLETFIACYDHVTRINGDTNAIAIHLFSTTEYSANLEGDQVVFKEEFEAPERSAEIPLTIYASLLKSLHAYIKALRFYPNGQEIIQDNYSSGRRNGKWKAWYENGQLEFKGCYLNNVKFGEWIYYYSNGALSSCEAYDINGNAVGIQTRWYKNEKLACENHCWDTETPGYQQMWDEDGELIYDGKFSLPEKRTKPIEQYDNDHAGLKEIWQKYMKLHSIGVFNNGIRENEIPNFKAQLSEPLLKVLEISNGQKMSVDGIFAFPRTSGGNYRFHFLSCEDIVEIIARLKNREGVYEKFPERYVPFAMGNADTLKDLLCFDKESGRILWVWDEYEEAQEPFWFQGNVYHSRDLADNLETFIKNQIGLNFYTEEKNVAADRPANKQNNNEQKKKPFGVNNGIIILYDLNSEDLKVNVEAYFEGESLVIDGFDVGKIVKDKFGDSDYEYKMTLPEEEVSKLFTIWAIERRSKNDLLLEVYRHFSGEHCFSGLKSFFDANKIRYEYFSWT